MNQPEFDITLKEELYWPIKSEIPYNDKSENFADYLQKEEEKFNIPRSKTAKILAIILSLVLIFVSLLAIIATMDLIIELIIGSIPTGEIIPGIPNEVSIAIQIAVLIATALGCIFASITIIYVNFFTQKNWSMFHNQLLALCRRLEKVDLLENYIIFQKDEDRFRLTKISTDWELEWVFPFIFTDFPPLLIEILLMSFLLPFSLSTLVGIGFAIAAQDLLTTIVPCVLMIPIIFGFYKALPAIYHILRIYYLVRKAMIIKQQEKLHSLILEKADELTILRNQNNLSRLLSRHPFPLPSLIRITAIVPLLGSVVGYLIGVIYT
ncbi:MAG: hypothetical protein ACFFCZ_22675 [Promethearchaeota archaeon]